MKRAKLIEEPEGKSCWQLGFDAFHAGVPFSDAPLYSNGAPYTSWQNGWIWARQQSARARKRLEAHALKEK